VGVDIASCPAFRIISWRTFSRADKLTAQRNPNFLESVLLELLGDVTGIVSLWMQHDRAPARCEEGKGQWLNTIDGLGVEVRI